MTQRRKRPAVMLELDRDLGSSVLQLGDCIKLPGIRRLVTAKIYSLLLVYLLMDEEDNILILDGFERILNEVEIKDEMRRDRLFGEFLSLQNYFKDFYRRHQYMMQELERVLRDMEQEFPENVFHVEWSPHGDVVMVS